MKLYSKKYMFSEKKIGIFFSICISICFLAYSSIYIHTFPLSEGWGIMYVEQLFQGKIPYRDFYYYLPPLNLLIDAIFWKLSFGYLIIFRVFWVLQRMLIILIVFNVFQKYFSLSTRLIASILSIFLSTASVYDLLGDYNQTAALLAVIMAYFTSGFADQHYRSSKYRNLFYAGLVLGLMFLVKQTIFLASTMVHFVVLCGYCWRKKDSSFLSYCGSVIAGFLIPLTITFLLLVFTGSLIPFIDQVYINVDGKGDFLSILFGFFWTGYKNFKIISIVFGVVVFVKSVELSKDLEVSKRKFLRFLVAIFMISVILALYMKEIKESILLLIRFRKTFAIFIVSLIPAIIWCLLTGKNLKKNSYLPFFTQGVSLLFFISMMLVWGSTNQDVSYGFYESTSLFSLVSTFLYPFIFAFLILISICYVLLDSNTMNDGMLFIVSASVSHIYAAAMAAGSSEVAYHGFLFALPLFLCICLDYSDGRENLLRILKLIIVIVCIFFSIACIGQKRINAYNWWGSIDEPYYVKTEYSDIKALKGIKLSAHTREVYEVITKLIKENGTDKDTIWGYPHVKLFNVLSDNYNMDTFMPVVFYDVSADFYIEQETELLSSNLPDFIIWQDIPGVKEIHEDVFRDGKLLKQRDMETMLEKEISEKYILIGEIDSIKIYRHNQGQPIRYTYGISRLES